MDIREILELLEQGNNSKEISIKLGTTRQNIHTRLTQYVKRNKEAVFPCDEPIRDIEGDVLKGRLTVFACKNLFLHKNRYLIDKKFRPIDRSSIPEAIAKALKKDTPINENYFFKEAGLDTIDKKLAKEALISLFPKKIFFIKGFVIYIKRARILKLINILGGMYRNIEEMYIDIKNNDATKVFFKEEDIQSFESFLDRINLREMDPKYFIKTANARWELKATASSIENQDEIVKYCVEVAAKYFCGFHLNLLYKKVKEKFNQDFSPIDLKVILENSGNFFHYKARMLKQNSCEKTTSTVEAVSIALKECNREDIQCIISKLKEKGRDLSRNSILVALVEAKKNIS